MNRMLHCLFTLLLLIAVDPALAAPSVASNASSLSPKSALKLQARIQKPDVPARNWLKCSAAEIKSSFVFCSAIGSAEHDLSLELPKEMVGLFSAPENHHDCFKREPAAGSRPQSMHFCSLNRWRYHLMCALQQLEWELGTDPAQGVRKLGRYYGGQTTWANVAWNDSPGARKYIDIDYEDKKLRRAGIITVPALGYRTNFSGTAKILLVFHPHRKVEVKVLESTLPETVNHRFVESFKSLNGHPVSEVPADHVDLAQVPVVCNIYFNHARKLRRPVHKDVVFGIGTTEQDW